MRKFLLLLLLSYEANCQCSFLSVSSCNPSAAEVIMTVPLPEVPSATSVCQSLCQAQENCLFWLRDGTDLTCTLLHYSYLSSCLFLSGPAEPEFTVCLSQDSNTCADLVHEHCTLNGQVLFQSADVTDSHTCQEFLRILGPVYGAVVFSYSSLDNTCSLLGSNERSCMSMSGPRYPVVEECMGGENNTTSTTISTSTATSTMTNSHSPVDGYELAIAGPGSNMKVINALGICPDVDFYPHPHTWLGPRTITYLQDWIVGCGASTCCCGGCTGQWQVECWKYNMDQGWVEMAHPYKYSAAQLNSTAWGLDGGLVNINERMFYVSEWGIVEEYNATHDHWSKISKIPLPQAILVNCVLSIGNNNIFVKTLFKKHSYKFNIDTQSWVRLNDGLTDRIYDNCLKVDLPGGGVGVLSVGGRVEPEDVDTMTVELLDMNTGVWVNMAPIDQRWRWDYGLLILGGKPTIIGQFNSTNTNVMEQFDLENNVWTIEGFDFSNRQHNVWNAINIPSSFFPSCSP